MFAKDAFPERPLPRATFKGFLGSIKSFSLSIEARPTVDFTLFGISIPTRDLPGIGASMRIG